MQDIPANTISASTLLSYENGISSPLSQGDDFSEVLDALGVTYSSSEYYWQVGEIKKVQGWILHLSIIGSQLTELVNFIVPILVSHNVPFKLVKDRYTAGKLISGSFNHNYAGKIICIYPHNDQKALELAKMLIGETKHFKGPSILTDFCLGNIVFTRYGSFMPMIVKDSKGEPVKHIYNEKGELVPDPYHVPFSMPRAITWPFKSISNPVIPKSWKLLNYKYYPISIIKSDLRGNVYKALYFSKLWNVRACIIKQGRKNMASDEYGRDIGDRLKWQHHLYKELADHVPLPEVFDYFIEKEDIFLAIEFIKGRSVAKWLDSTYKGRAWFDLPRIIQQQVFENLILVIEIIQRLHERGFVHRDITPNNFIINRQKRIVPIDLELTWSLHLGIPSPPFQLGTPGYTSPEQSRTEIPTIKEDIYALGAFLMESCTNLNPMRLPHRSTEALKASLTFFIRNNRISNLIWDCLEEDPSKRPDLSALKLALISCREQLNTNTISDIRAISEPDPSKLRTITQAAVYGLVNPEILSPKQRWLSIKHLPQREADNGQQELTVYEGWHTGMAGPLWLMALAKYAGFDVEPCREAYNQSWDYIYTHSLKNPVLANPSLYYGCAGIALALTEGLKSGLLLSDIENMARLSSCFSLPSTELTLSEGVAGQGIALLHALPWLDRSNAPDILTSYLTVVLKSQKPNGSWDVKVASEKKGNPALGVDNGVSGIIWFLLTYLKQFPDPNAKLAVTKSINWLTRNKLLQFKNKSNDAFTVKSFGSTATTVTLIMIKAYEVLGDPTYKEWAESNLRSISAHLVLSNFTLNGGLAKIGELYLEAYRVFNESIWLDRATWIAQVFQYTFQWRDEKEGHWFTNDDYNITADLYTGHSGIIHFLIRYLTKDTTNYPL